MSGVMDRNNFALHRKVIGQEFCSIVNYSKAN